MNNKVQESKRLAYLLRHSCLPDHNGWVSISVLIQEYNFVIQDLERIVFEDIKARFEFSDDGLSVRALYGHSIDVDLELVPSSPPAILYHGTAVKYIERITKEGLKPRKRNFVHLSETMDMAKQVGTRHGSPVVLSIDIEAMIRAGYKFYKAQNGIWLTGYIPPKFLKVVCYE
ncbi:MAG: RNA 2'-phosphotransferase [Bacteroidales bacterium]|nr:RNA 2'-phosphotransferase [Bacteroidales bacterium]